MRWWKWLGLAGLAGVTATGIVVAQAERRRRSYTAGEVRERLHTRLEEASTTGPAASAAEPAPGRPAGSRVRDDARRKLSNLLRRGRRIRHAGSDRQ